MDLHDLWVVIHVLAWVFWLGTDIGVFLAAKMSENGSYTPETRLTVLKLGMYLDVAPRIAVPVVFITGVMLSNDIGFELIPPLAGWTFGLIWLAAVLIGITTEGGQTPFGKLAMRFQFLINSIIAIGMGGLAIAGLAQAVDMPAWLAVKWLAFAVVAIAAIVLEKTFGPAIMLYGKLGTDGASSKLNTDLSAALKPVYWAVLVIYAATLVAGITGLIHN